MRRMILRIIVFIMFTLVMARRLESIALFKKHIEDTVENLNVLLDERNRILNSGA